MDKLKILIVDDEPDITTIMKKGLEMHSYDVDTFNHPKEALSQFNGNYYDAIVLDIRMPEMDGFRLSREIWKRDSNAQICFMTAFEIYEKEARKVFSNLPSYCFIKKPISISELAEHIQKHLLSHNENCR